MLPLNLWIYLTNRHHKNDMEVRQRKKVDATFNMSSMTDIVFLLLIFFIVLSTFVSPPGVVVDLPKADTNMQSQPSTITINIDAEGNYFINSQAIGYEALLNDLRSKVTTMENAAVKLAADGKVPLEVGVALFADVKKLGYKKVVIATQPVKK